MSPEAVEKFTEDRLPEFTEEEKGVPGQIYTKDQLKAIEIGEAAIDPKDLTIQGRLRTDIARPLYLDDYSTLQPVIDRFPKSKLPADKKAKFMSPDEFGDDFIKWLESSKVENEERLDELPDDKLGELLDDEGQSQLKTLKYFLDRPSLTGTGSSGSTSLAPALGRDIPGVTEYYQTKSDPEDEGLDETGEYTELKKKKGLKVMDILGRKATTLVTRHVHNQRRLGKIRSESIIAMSGNGKGMLGIGTAKSTEPQVANMRAMMAAIQNMRPIPRFENRTIYGNVKAKVSGTVVELSARPPGMYLTILMKRAAGHADLIAGFGLRVPPRIFEMCRAAGISDLAARIPRSRNPMNSVKATFEALTNQPNPEEIAIGRGKKLVDVRKVYYGGAVY